MGMLRHGPQSWSYVESGRLDEIRILEIIGRLGAGDHELICHPSETDIPARDAEGRPYQGAEELTARFAPTACARRPATARHHAVPVEGSVLMSDSENQTTFGALRRGGD